MENCFYHDRTICIFDLKDESGLYYEDIVLEWKQAAADRQLICMECGAPVYLAAGPIKEPYFAHYDLENCNYGNVHETEELRKGKRLLYYLLKRSFPDSNIRARYRMENGMYNSLFCQLGQDYALAIDYRLQNNSLEKYRLRDSFYQTNKIKPIYIMGIRQEKDTKQIDWYQSLLQTSMGYLAFLDTEHENMILKKSFSYRLGKERKFKYLIKTYPVRELKLNRLGQMLCDFSEEGVLIENIIAEEKTTHDKRREQLQRLSEEKLRLNEKKERQLEEYRRIKTMGDKPDSKEPANHNMVQDLNPVILEKCRKMINEGNSQLVSKKYYDAIMTMHFFNKR